MNRTIPNSVVIFSLQARGWCATESISAEALLGAGKVLATWNCPVLLVQLPQEAGHDELALVVQLDDETVCSMLPIQSHDSSVTATVDERKFERGRPRSGPRKLSIAELEVLDRTRRGMKELDMATDLGISLSAVKRRKARLCKHMGLRFSEIVSLANTYGLLPLDRNPLDLRPGCRAAERHYDDNGNLAYVILGNRSNHRSIETDIG